MVSRAAPALTRIGFRRDVTLFLTVLVSFLAILILLLVLLLQSNLSHMRIALIAREEALADAAMSEVRRAAVTTGDLETQLTAIRTRYGFAAIEVQRGRGPVVISGRTGEGLETIERTLPGGTARFYHDTTAYEGIRRRSYLTAAVAVAAALLGVALLLLYLPKILRPIEAMLGEARELGEREPQLDEAAYLIETFRSSIATLKKQEAELKELHEREKARADDLQTITSTLTRSLTSGLIALGRDNLVVDMNGAARDILEIPRDEVLAERTIVDALGVNPLAEILERAASTRAPLSRQEIELTVGAQQKTIGLTTVPLFSDHRTYLGMLALFTDLTQVRRLETRVRDLQTLADLGVMSAGIAHEFRNSLSTILGLLKLAARTQPPADVAAKLSAAEAEAMQLSDAVTGLLQFARPMGLQVADVDLAELAGVVVSRLRETEPDVVFEVHAEESFVRGDATLLARALENLLRNAVEAVQETGRAGVVRVEVRGGTAPAIDIIDNGVGIADSDAANLFLPFHSTKPRGTGIGLPLARKIILLHGGSIRFDSAPGAGTTVHIDLAEAGVTFPPNFAASDSALQQ